MELGISDWSYCIHCPGHYFYNLW
ncbi:hypothetical protein Bhyg_00930 [Pseudolycoriella hygida]|uniref:Uncharacterized protein n=1 Tax=Pseudolycoriella hygida TaxID=35572 RepID=A0A9Q0NA30_9DIPT|nr:hypothetical protein Bhyg_00930 [Pseudolycoriella hygida]